MLGKITRGHMNVLLAEANVAYDHLYDIEAIKDEFAGTGVAPVVGANDVVNPAAKTDPGVRSTACPCSTPNKRIA